LLLGNDTTLKSENTTDTSIGREPIEEQFNFSLSVLNAVLNRERSSDHQSSDVRKKILPIFENGIFTFAAVSFSPACLIKPSSTC
jgi:hypothetical protein